MQENIVETKEEDRSMNKTPRKKIFFQIVVITRFVKNVRRYIEITIFKFKFVHCDLENLEK